MNGDFYMLHKYWRVDAGSFTIVKLDAGMWRYHANRMDARRSQFDLGRVIAYI